MNSLLLLLLLRSILFPNSTEIIVLSLLALSLPYATPAILLSSFCNFVFLTRIDQFWHLIFFRFVRSTYPSFPCHMEALIPQFDQVFHFFGGSCSKSWIYALLLLSTFCNFAFLTCSVNFEARYLQVLKINVSPSSPEALIP